MITKRAILASKLTHATQSYAYSPEVDHIHEDMKQEDIGESIFSANADNHDYSGN